MRFILAGTLILLAAAPAEPKITKGSCKSRCSVMYSACLKRTTTAKGREGCKAERNACKGNCR
jgi:hypothetical protein